MANASDTHGTVFKESSTVLVARVLGSDGLPIEQADVAALEYSIFELDPCDPNGAEVVAGHDRVVLSTSAVVLDTLQTDALWTAGEVGYNFRHEIDVAINEAFPNAGVHYQVRYEVTPVSGQKVVFRFLLRAI